MSSAEITTVFETSTQLMMIQAKVFTTQAKAMLAQANRVVGPHVKPNANTPASRFWDFIGMNPSNYHGTKVVSINLIYKVKLKTV